MSATERNFHDFELGDNVYELAHGLIPEIAERLGIELGAEPNSQELFDLVGKIGKNKVLRDNEEVTALRRGDMVQLVLNSGVQNELDRNLWTPMSRAGGGFSPFSIVLTGAVANWQDRATQHVERKIERTKRWEDAPIYYAAGTRVMDAATEKTNPNVKKLFKMLQRYPTEAEYAGAIAIPRLGGIFSKAVPTTFPTEKGDELAAMFFDLNSHLLDEKLVFVRVANAGIQLAIQMRQAALKRKSDFDSQEDPQVYIATDTFPLAYTEEQEAQPTQYQKAQSALRQVVLTAKVLHEAAGGE